jgi:hypothetical protein
MFGACEFDMPRQTRYLGDVRFFKQELMSSLTNDEDEAKDNGDEEGDDDANEGEADDSDGETTTIETSTSTTVVWRGIRSMSRRISTRSRPSSSPLTKMRSTSSPTGMASPSSFANLR